MDIKLVEMAMFCVNSTTARQKMYLDNQMKGKEKRKKNEQQITKLL